MKPCKHCGEQNPKHWPYQCFKKTEGRHKTLKHAEAKWKRTRTKWLLDNLQENYNCYLCGKFLWPYQVTLDHIVPRSKRPDLVNEPTNLAPCCYECNTEKGSKVVGDYERYEFKHK